MLSLSQRRYQNLTFYGQRPGLLTDELIRICQSQKWKNVKIWSEKINDSFKLQQFLLSFQETVESLELRNFIVGELSTLDFEDKRFKMKNLKSLRLCNVTNVRSLIVNLKCSQLELLEIENGCDETLISFLSASKNLKTLEISEENWNEKFLDGLSKLKSLKIMELKIKAFSRRTAEAEHFQSVLKRVVTSQADNLEVFSFDLALSYGFLKVVLNLPKLRVLNISTPTTSNVDEDEASFPTSKNITELRLKFHCDANYLFNIIKSTPNLKILAIASVKTRDDKFNDLVHSCLPKLEKLEI